MSNKNIIKLIVGGIVIIVTLLLILLSAFTVKTGEVAIISRFGKINRIEENGLNFKIPIVETKQKLETREKIYYFAKTDEADTSLTVSTKDIQTINIEVTVQASITDPQKLYKAFNNKHESRYIRPRVKEITQATISKYTIEEFVTERAKISREIFEDLKDDFELYGLSLSNISIINHDFSDAYEEAIEQKKVAEQAVEKAKAEQLKLAVEAENKVKLAEYQLKEKELQAKANAVESNSLSPQLLKKMYIEKWDGKLPTVQTNGNSNLLLDISK